MSEKSFEGSQLNMLSPLPTSTYIANNRYSGCSGHCHHCRCSDGFSGGPGSGGGGGGGGCGWSIKGIVE